MNPNRITQYRAYLTWSIRAIAVGFGGAAGVNFITRIIYGLSALSHGGDFWGISFGFARRGAGAGANALSWIIINLIVATILLLIAKRLARSIITIPPTNCPACNYPRPIITPQSENNRDDPPLQPSTYCPECGLHGFTPANPQAKPDNSDQP